MERMHRAEITHLLDQSFRAAHCCVDPALRCRRSRSRGRRGIGHRVGGGSLQLIEHSRQVRPDTNRMCTACKIRQSETPQQKKQRRHSNSTVPPTHSRCQQMLMLRLRRQQQQQGECGTDGVGTQLETDRHTASQQTNTVKR